VCDCQPGEAQLAGFQEHDLTVGLQIVADLVEVLAGINDVALSDADGFACALFWQPCIKISQKQGHGVNGMGRELSKVLY
jgi:hypothetical protein